MVGERKGSLVGAFGSTCVVALRDEGRPRRARLHTSCETQWTSKPRSCQLNPPRSGETTYAYCGIEVWIIRVRESLCDSGDPRHHFPMFLACFRLKCCKQTVHFRQGCHNQYDAEFQGRLGAVELWNAGHVRKHGVHEVDMGVTVLD